MDCLLGSLEGGEFASHEAELGETPTNFLKLEKKITSSLPYTCTHTHESMNRHTLTHQRQGSAKGIHTETKFIVQVISKQM